MAVREMKDSGIDWIDLIPAHWETKRLQFCLHERNVKNFPIQTKEILSLSVKKGITLYSEREGGGNKAKEDLTAYKVVKTNDIVMNSMNVLEGAVNMSPYDGCVSPVYYIFNSPNFIETCYFNLLFQTKAFQKSLFGLGNGILIKESSEGKYNTIRMRIPIDKLKRVKLPYPPYEEAKKIVSFLSQRVNEIDTLSTNIEKQIETLQEFKKAQITEELNNLEGMCVEVPLWSICQCNLESLPENTKEDLEFDYVDISSVSYGKGITKTEHFTFKDAPSRARRKAQVGDILISTVRTYLRAIARVDEEHADCIFSTGFSVLKPKPHVNGDYLAFLLQTENFIHSVISHSKGVGYPAINSSQLMHLKVHYCNSMETQKNVARNLLRKCKEIDATIEEKQKQLEILSQYKQSLIYEVVTGKKEIECSN